jgi:hypothetical protein
VGDATDPQNAEGIANAGLSNEAVATEEAEMARTESLQLLSGISHKLPTFRPLVPFRECLERAGIDFDTWVTDGSLHPDINLSPLNPYPSQVQGKL